MGESTTGTGRMVLNHQCAKANELLTGEYDMYGDAIIYGDSVTKDTIIETKEGKRKIKELFEGNVTKLGTKEYAFTSAYALTYNTDSKKNEFRKIKYVVRHKVNKDIYRVWIGNTRYVDVTQDHSLIGYANSRSKNTGLVEVKPTEIGKNFVNSLLLSSHMPYIPEPSYNLSKEMYQMIGFVIGDGYVEKKKESGVGLSIGQVDKTEVIHKLINPLIKQGWFTSYHEKKNGHDIRLCGVRGWKFLREHLYSSGKKDFPSWVFNETVENIGNILNGYFSADGFANTNKVIQLTSVNRKFIETTNELLKRCGIGSNYYTEGRENSYEGKKSGTHTIRLTIYDSVRFARYVGFIQDRKNKNVKLKYSKASEHQSKQSGYVLIQPTRIEKIDYTDYVYDIEVDDTHTFYANDILVHNTDSTYFNTFGGDVEESILIGDTVAKQVNDSFKQYMQETFLCQPNFDDKIKCGREIVASAGIFISKKRYILKIIDNEGERVDKLKAMGVDTKRTTMPPDIAKKLNSYVNRILEDEEWEVIRRDIVNFKEWIKTTDDIMQIGIPSGVNNIEVYESRMKKDSKATLPGHVRASIYYNMLLDEYEDTASIRIISGMKIKVFYINEVEGKFKSIALPTDIEVVPQWFKDNFSIDRNKHIERLVDSPLGNIINAIGIEVPKPQDLIVEELFGI